MNAIAAELIGICRHFGVFERESVCCGSVSVPQCLVLQQLLDGACDMSALASQAGASLSAMTRLVDGLERRGWVTRARPGDDRRRVVAKLTAAGRREATRLRAETEAIISTVLRRIPAAKHPQVLEAVRLLRTAMDELRESGRTCCAS